MERKSRLTPTVRSVATPGAGRVSGDRLRNAEILSESASVACGLGFEVPILLNAATIGSWPVDGFHRIAQAHHRDRSCRHSQSMHDQRTVALAPTTFTYSWEQARTVPRRTFFTQMLRAARQSRKAIHVSHPSAIRVRGSSCEHTQVSIFSVMSCRRSGWSSCVRWQHQSWRLARTLRMTSAIPITTIGIDSAIPIVRPYASCSTSGSGSRKNSTVMRLKA
jgi:hypothetical protein